MPSAIQKQSYGSVTIFSLAEIQQGQPLAQEALTNGRILWQRQEVQLLL